MSNKTEPYSFSAMFKDEDEAARIDLIGTPVYFGKGFDIYPLVTHLDPANEGKYRISEAITGRALIGPQETPQLAFEVCQKFLKTITPQQLGDKIAYFLMGPGRDEEPRP